MEKMMNLDLFNILAPIVIGTLTFLWLYCIWYANKYDKDLNSTKLLLALNLFYVPIYLVRIREIKIAKELEKISEEINDSEFIQQSRNGILDTIERWSSKEQQLSLKEFIDDKNITYELFSQWTDSYNIDSKIINEAFVDSEKEMLKSFNKSLMIIYEKFKDTFPSIIDFQDTDDWKTLNKMALQIIEELK